jgi:hypothetical protein
VPLKRSAIVCAAFSLAICLVAIRSTAAQTASSAINTHPLRAKPLPVTYLFPEQITVAADKPTSVDLHFKVADGLHVNSHNPHSEDLVPTTLKLPESSGVRLANAIFPPGADFAFPADPNEKLSVYTGEFTIHAELVATKGNHLVEATLRYQACNDQVCMPPRSIPVTIDVIAK